MQELMSYLPEFANALLVTLGVSLAAAVIGLTLGFALNAARIAIPGFALIYSLYVWLIRGTPFLAQLAVIYFGLPVIGLRLEAVEASILSLALYSGAYFAELFRSAWASVPHGQVEAARVHGISRVRVFWHVQAPQAMAFALPLLGNQVILTIKESAVTSIITVPELTMTAGRIVSTTFSYVMPYALLVLSYWLLTSSVAAIARALGQRMTRHLRG
ncbi:MAG: amino acid ABC transporter permease [Pseudomonas sp.]|jgi:His/Glu/Gln/Arg/opine family amino acid ABC transporter permease subunit|uniref:amino acid ABC transporter permease n=1 Tax=Pseudomonas sp. TaxID=306 RepID=UPI002381FAE4|nr:amino acid ABC transporter permease [Pseudomonas sp.]MDE1194223.1 amino acid ABC transporter permease [Pseudomonas sp.]